VTVSITSPDSLTVTEVQELFSLFSSAFEADRQGFEHDLLEKERVLRVRDDSGLEAFSTLKVYRPTADVRVVFSGNTYVSPRARAGHRLPALWAQYVFREMPKESGVDDYWLLLCSGYRTYRILPTFFQAFYPGPQGAQELDSCRDQWGRMIFGERYEHGIVKPRWATPLLDPDPPDRLLTDPHVQFFLQANPGFREGHELVCLLSLTEENLRPAGRRLALRRA
jgi:hypothetical protein